MMTESPDIVAFTNLIDRLVRLADEEGLPSHDIHRRLTTLALLMAADLHCDCGGSDASFLAMARHSLALVRTGAMEQ